MGLATSKIFSNTSVRVREFLGKMTPRKILSCDRACPSSNKVTLWKADRHPGCRAVMMTLDALNLNVEEFDVDLDRYEHRSEEIMQMSPLGTLPILKHDKLILHDSHAICTYLASRFCENNKLMPVDPGGKALLDQALHYNSGVLYPRYVAMVCSVLYDSCKHLSPYQTVEVESSYADLEKLLSMENKPWFGGCWPTLADITLAATVSSLNVLVRIDYCKFPCLSCWLYRVSNQVFYNTGNTRGLWEFCRKIGKLLQSAFDFSCKGLQETYFKKGQVHN